MQELFCRAQQHAPLINTKHCVLWPSHMGYISSSFVMELTTVGLLVGGAAPVHLITRVSMLEGSIGILALLLV